MKKLVIFATRAARECAQLLFWNFSVYKNRFDSYAVGRDVFQKQIKCKLFLKSMQ